MQDSFSNRIDDRRRDTDSVKDVVISVKDIDVAVVNHIKEIIKPTVVQNNEVLIVPVHFANPEIWKSVQEYGFMRDGKTNQIMVPVVVVKNNGIAKNTQMPVDKFDGALRKTITTQWNPKNKTEIFNTIGKDMKPSMEYYSVIVPDYVIVSYQIIIWTSYIAHMNAIIEKFIYAENSYWGTGRFKFRTSYDNIPNTVDVEQGKNRAIKNTIDANVYGYIIPESFNNQDTTIKRLTPSKILFTTEFDSETEQTMSRRNIPTRVDDLDTIEKV